MRQNPHLKVHVAYGYYDGATPHFAAEDVIAHLQIPAELRANIEHAYYQAGHMMYVHEPTRLQQSKDLAAFVTRALGRLMRVTRRVRAAARRRADGARRDRRLVAARHVVPQAAYVDTVAPLASDEHIQDAVADELVAQTTDSLAGPPDGLAAKVRAAGADRRPGSWWRARRSRRPGGTSNRAAHKQIVGALAGESDHDPAPTTARRSSCGSARSRPRCGRRSTESGIPLGVAVPRTDTTYPIGDTADLARAQTAYNLLHDYGRALPFVAGGAAPARAGSRARARPGAHPGGGGVAASGWACSGWASCSAGRPTSTTSRRPSRRGRGPGVLRHRHRGSRDADALRRGRCRRGRRRRIAVSVTARRR